MPETELIIRGLIDKLIDDQLSDADLDLIHKTFEDLRPKGAIRDDRRDAVFGFIMGAVQAHFGELFRAIFKRNPTVEEIGIAVDVFSKRLPRIKSRIDETFT
jgi:hypothetical protein